MSLHSILCNSQNFENFQKLRRKLFRNPLSPMYAAAAALLQSCPTLCDPIDGSPPGSSIPGILQARTLEWVAISFSSACMLSRCSHVRLFATPWIAALQARILECVAIAFSNLLCIHMYIQVHYIYIYIYIYILL